MSDTERKKYWDWTPVDHYKAASMALETVSGIAEKVDAGELQETKKLEGILDAFMQRAQVHATLACVDPRIATMAMAQVHEEQEQKDRNGKDD